jgi:hypothetical protein
MKHYDEKAYRGGDEWTHVFLTAPLVIDEWLGSCPCRFTPVEKAYDIHWIGGWVDPRAGLADMKKRTFPTVPGLNLRPLIRAALSHKPITRAW